MNLYKILMTHAAPKDNQTAINEYVIAENEESLFNYLKYDSGYTYWDDVEKDGDTYDGEMKVIDFIFQNKGDLGLDSKWENLYYGSTMYQWELVEENIGDMEISVLVTLDIAKHIE
jgi:hypothetical protein